MAAVTFSINAIDKTRAVFARVNASVKNLSKSTNSFQNQILGAGLGVLGAGTIFTLAGNQVRDLIRNIEDIPGIPEETRQSIIQMRDDLAEVNNNVNQLLAPLVSGFSKGTKSLGLFVGALSTLDFKDLLNPAQAYETILGRIDDALQSEADATRALMQEQNKQAQAALENAKKEKQAIDELAKAKRAMEERERLASSITDRNLTSTERFNKEVSALRSVKDLLSPETFTREFERLRNTLLNPTASTGLGAPSKPLTDQFTRIGFLNDRGTSANEAMQSEAKKQTNLLQTIADTLKKGMAAPRREIYGGAAILT